MPSAFHSHKDPNCRPNYRPNCFLHQYCTTMDSSNSNRNRSYYYYYYYYYYHSICNSICNNIYNNIYSNTFFTPPFNIGLYYTIWDE